MASYDVQKIGKLVMKVTDLHKTNDQFELIDLSMRIAGELVLGLETEKINNLFKKGFSKFLADQDIDELLKLSELVQNSMNSNR